MSETDKTTGPVIVTRERLYDEVWVAPMIRVAERYGISGNGLAKICDRLDVPYPSRGHWARKAAGQTVQQTPLPEAKADGLLQVEIRPTQFAPTEVSAEAQATIAAVARATTIITVSERLLRPHPIIAGWIREKDEALKRARRDRREHGWSFDPGPFTESEHRQHLLLDAILKALEREGAKTNTEHRRLFAEFGAEKIEFALRERKKQVRHPRTDAERKLGYGQFKQELQPTGLLVFEIKRHLPRGLTQTWTETEKLSLEMLLPNIVATFVAASPLLAEETRNRREAERLAQIEQMRRYEEEQLRKRDDNRWRRFVEMAGRRRESEIALGLIEALRARPLDEGVHVDGRSPREWLDWAEERARSRDPANHDITQLFVDVANVTAWTYSDRQAHSGHSLF